MSSVGGAGTPSRASLTQLCMALGPVVSDCGQQLFGGRTWFPPDISFGKGAGRGGRPALWQQAGCIVAPWARLYDHTVPTYNSQESHFLPHPLQGPDEGGREGFWMDIRSWQLEMVFRCITECGTNPGKLPCNPINHQQMALLATRQDSGILDCSVVELEPGTEVETLRP